MNLFSVRHVTRFRYSEPAVASQNTAHLCVRPTPHQDVVESWVVVDPPPDDRSERLDEFGNWVTYFSVDSPHSTLEVRADSVVRHHAAGCRPGLDEAWEAARDAVAAIDDVDLTLASPHVPLVDGLAHLTDGIFAPGRPLRDAVGELAASIYSSFSYVPGATTVSTPLDEVLDTRRGVCQDFAHVAIGALRRLGLACRYVSGYLETYPPPGVPKLRGADASHAWVSVRAADGSWFDIDPTNGTTGLDTHITLAWGRDYADVAPLRGVLTSAGSATEMTVEVDVERLES